MGVFTRERMRRRPRGHKASRSWGVYSGNLTSQLPHGHHHADHFVGEDLDGLAVLPPVVGVKIAVAGAGDPHVDGLGKNVLENVTGAASMELEVTTMTLCQWRSVTSAASAMASSRVLSASCGNLMMRFARDATLDQVVLHQFRDACGGAQAAPAGHDDRRQLLTKQLRGAGGPVGEEIVVAEHHDGVGVVQRVFDYPGLASKPHQGTPRQVNGGAENDDEQQACEAAEDSAALPRPGGWHAMPVMNQDPANAGAPRPVSGKTPLK